jgi:hypothetical protein
MDLESPWYYAKRNADVKGKATLTKIYGGVPGYNVENEWNVIVDVLDEERKQAETHGVVSFWEIFRGPNLVSHSVLAADFQVTGQD